MRRRRPMIRRSPGSSSSPSSSGLRSAGVATTTVARIERDEIEPRMTTLRKLARGLEVDPAELVGE